MDLPRSIPEVSSPVVLLPPSSGMLGMATSSGARTSVRRRGRNQPRTRRVASVTTPASAVRTSTSFPSSIRSRGEDTTTTGPTTRSRKRSYTSTIDITNTPATASAASVPDPPGRRNQSPSASRKRKASTATGSRKNARRSTSIRKKPPPRAGLKKAPPAAATAVAEGKSDGSDDTVEKEPAAKAVNCCICMCDVEPKDLAMINGCDHQFCFGCIEKWSERENKCPLCKTRFTKIERVIKQKKKKGTKTKNSKQVKQRDQRSDLAPGAALEGLIANLNRNHHSLARIIFGGFEFGGPRPPIARMASARTTTSRNASARTTSGRAAFSTVRTSGVARADVVDDDSDEYDDDSPMAAFMRALHGSSVANSVRMSTTVIRPMTLTAHFSTSTRSFARNVHDSTAGNGADNPLEIDDDSVEEIIEID